MMRIAAGSPLTLITAVLVEVTVWVEVDEVAVAVTTFSSVPPAAASATVTVCV